MEDQQPPAVQHVRQGRGLYGRQSKTKKECCRDACNQAYDNARENALPPSDATLNQLEVTILETMIECFAACPE